MLVSLAKDRVVNSIGALFSHVPRPLRNTLEYAGDPGLLGADPLPRDAAGLREWIDQHPDLSSSDAQRSAVEFLARPPLSPPVRLAYHFLYEAALATVPDSLTDLVGVRPRPNADKVGRAATSALRWALGSSPSWHLALVRAGAAVPPGVFRQQLPEQAQQHLARTSTPWPRQGRPVCRPNK